MVDTLHGFAVVLRLCPENVRYEGLGIAVDERKPAALDLDHDPVSLEKAVIGLVQVEAVFLDPVRGDGFRLFEAPAKPAAQDVPAELYQSRFGTKPMISVAAGASEIPAALLAQLNDPGILVIPVGELDDQELRVLTLRDGRVDCRVPTLCRFVPLRGGEGWQ